MELREIENQARVALDDLVTPYRFAEDDLRRWANEAVQEACIRTRVIQDSTSALASISVTAGTSRYALNKAIFAIRRARIDDERHPLELVDVSQLDESSPGWDDAALAPAGTPRYGCFDFGTGDLVLSPVPAESGTLRLLIWRSPTDVEQMFSRACQPAIPEHMHRELFHWICAQAYLIPDQETSNAAQAQLHLSLFEAAYGEKPTLQAIRRWSTQRRRHVRPHYD